MNNQEKKSYINYLSSNGYALTTQKAYLQDLEQYYSFCKHFNQDFYDFQSFYRFFSYLSGNLKQEPSSLERKRASLKVFFNFLTLYKNHKNFDFQKLKTPRKKKPLPNHYSDKEIKKLLKSFDLNKPLEHRNYFFILLAFGTGLRLSEILSLNAKNISSAGKVVVLGKGNKERVVFLPRPVMKKYFKYYQRFKDIIEKNQALFFNHHKKPLSPSGAQKILKNIGIKNGFSKNLHPHAFRHSFATRLLEEGADVRKVSEMLGHASLSTTQKYTHLSKKILKETYTQFHPHG